MVGERNKKWAAVLIVLILIVGSLSGCLGGEKKNEKPNVEDYNAVAEDFEIALDALASTKQLDMDAYDARFDHDFEKAIELKEEVKRLHMKSLNHSRSALNKTSDPTLIELINHLIEANRYFVQADEMAIQRFEFDSKQDFDNAKIAGDKASDFYSMASKHEDKVLEILEDLLPSSRVLL